MIFGVAHLVWYLSQFMVLDPGDVINTGTPAGVALGLPGGSRTCGPATWWSWRSTAWAGSGRRSGQA